MSLLKSTTREDFEKYVKESFSKSDVIKKCGLIAYGSNYRAYDILKKRWGIDDSHFSGRGHLKGKTHNWSHKIPTSEILVKDSTYQSNKLRIRLIKEGILEKQCNKCYNKKWLDKDIPLELEHKNGDKFDNRLENLELLCPNCHTFTLTYRGKNKKH